METETETSRDPISGQVGRIGVQGRIWGFWGGGGAGFWYRGFDGCGTRFFVGWGCEWW